MATPLTRAVGNVPMSYDPKKTLSHHRPRFPPCSRSEEAIPPTAAAKAQKCPNFCQRYSHSGAFPKDGERPSNPPPRGRRLVLTFSRIAFSALAMSPSIMYSLPSALESWANGPSVSSPPLRSSASWAASSIDQRHGGFGEGRRHAGHCHRPVHLHPPARGPDPPILPPRSPSTSSRRKSWFDTPTSRPSLSTPSKSLTSLLRLPNRYITFSRIGRPVLVPAVPTERYSLRCVEQNATHRPG